MSDLGEQMWIAARDGKVQEMLGLLDGGADIEWKDYVSNPRTLPAHRPAPRRPPTHPRPAHPATLAASTRVQPETWAPAEQGVRSPAVGRWQWGYTALHISAEYNQTACVSALIGRAVNLNAMNNVRAERLGAARGPSPRHPPPPPIIRSFLPSRNCKSG